MLAAAGFRPFDLRPMVGLVANRTGLPAFGLSALLFLLFHFRGWAMCRIIKRGNQQVFDNLRVQ
jgi:hypothetical protein